MSVTTDWVSAVANLLAAVGTVGAVIVALFQDQIRRWLFPTRASITQNDPQGEVTRLGEAESILMFHLRVVNTSRHRALRGCRVVVTEVDRHDDIDGRWVSTVLAVPQPLHWAPQGLEPVSIDIPPDGTAIADFAYYRNPPGGDGPVFIPLLRMMPNNFPGVVEGMGKVRYRVELQAANLDTPARITLEVNSSGAWAIPPENIRGAVSLHRVGHVR